MSDGTMFRLPVSDKRMPRDCKLSDQTVSCDTIKRLFARFQPLLLTVCCFHPVGRSIEKKIDELAKSYAVVTNLSPEDQDKYDICVRRMRKPSADLSDKSQQISDIRSSLGQCVAAPQHVSCVTFQSHIADYADRSQKR
jgi:hypothetical protein